MDINNFRNDSIIEGERKLKLFWLLIISSQLFIGGLTNVDGKEPVNDKPSVGSSTSFRAISYNVQFLPGPARSKNKRGLLNYRANQLVEKLSGFDIIALNETFDDEPRKIIYTGIQNKWGENYHYIYGPDPGDGRYNGGLSLFSRFPFVETHTVVYKNYSSPLKYGLRADGFAAKGVLHARIKIPFKGTSETKLLDIFVTHLEARDGSLRRKQFYELAEFMNKHTSANIDFMLLGDLNTRGNFQYRAAPNSTYNQLFGVLRKGVPDHRVVDTWFKLNPKKDGGTAYQIKPTGGPRIDYIVIGQPNNSKIFIQVKKVRVNPYLDKKVKALSDHSAVEATLKW
jgi:endonuclease/exonuclease/phosphatase family metal-dependent hydrolase